MQRNKKKAKGLILGVSSFDAALPASGIAVWQVNDWYLRETLQYGIANLWGGDTLCATTSSVFRLWNPMVC